jgi:GST-like protein
MTDTSYTPPKIWQWHAPNGGKFAGINRPIAGARYEKDLPEGIHPLQLYSLATPNGVKITILLEELLEMGIKEAEYDAHLIDIIQEDQFSSGFTALNPNSKIPVLLDKAAGNISVFESGAILLYLAEKFSSFITSDPAGRADCLSWLFWQVGSGPYLGGGFGHFYAYAPDKYEYAIDRFTMETKRQLDLLDKQLTDKKYICGIEYSIADMAIWPWYGRLAQGALYDDADEFLQVDSYPHLQRWAAQIARRPAVKRGLMVNRTWGEPEQQLHERHDATDFETRTQDKLMPK